MGARNFQLPIKFHPGQQVVYDDPHRFKVIAGSRRWGKTKFGGAWTLTEAAVPNTKHFIIFPTARQAREVLWEELKAFIPYELVRRSNKTELNITLVNDSIIGLRGSDVEKSLRGNKLNSVVFDEAAYQKEYVWTDIIRPQLMDTLGKALFISSPGRPWFERLWRMGQNPSNKEWKSWKYTIYDNPCLCQNKADIPKEIESIKNGPDMTQATWNKEYMCVFGTGQVDFEVYPEFIPSKNGFVHGEKFQDHEKWPGVVGMDWGLRDNTSAVFVHFSPDCNTAIVSAEHTRNNWPVENHAEAIRKMAEGRNIEPGNYMLDKSAFGRRDDNNNTIAMKFFKNGIRCIPSEGSRDIGNNIVKKLLGTDKEKPRLFVSSRCQGIIDAFKKWEYGQHEPDCLAALRYAMYLGVKRRLIKGGMVADGVILYHADGKPNINEPPRLPLRRKEPEELSWNYDEGVPD